MTTQETTTRRTITVTRRYQLSQAGQREALRRGLPAATWQTVSAEVDLDEYLPLVRVDSAGVAGLELDATWREYDVPQTWEMVGLPWLREQLAKAHAEAAKAAAIEPTSAAFLADPSARREGTTYARGRTRAVWRGIALTDEASDDAARRNRVDQQAREDVRIAAYLEDPSARAHVWSSDIVLDDKATDDIETGTNGHVALIRDPHPRWTEIRAEVVRRKELDKERVEDARRARLVAKLAYLRDWIRDHGTDAQRERQAAGMILETDDKETRDRIEHLGLVPEQEILDAIRDRVFAPLAGESLYERIRASELNSLPDDRDDDYGQTPYGHGKGEMECESTVADEATPEQWSRVKAIRAKAPAGADVELRRHQCDCTTSSCDWGKRGHSVVRHGVLVRVTVTPGLDLHREYSC